MMMVGLAGCGFVPGALAAEKIEKSVDATAGKEFTISLESNQTTGFSWQLAKPMNEELLKSVKDEYQASPPAEGAPVVGRGGNHVWIFKALKPGKAVIEFKYVRPWEKDQEPAKVATVVVVIRDTGRK